MNSSLQVFMFGIVVRLRRHMEFIFYVARVVIRSKHESALGTWISSNGIEGRKPREHRFFCLPLDCNTLFIPSDQMNHQRTYHWFSPGVGGTLCTLGVEGTCNIHYLPPP